MDSQGAAADATARADAARAEVRVGGVVTRYLRAGAGPTVVVLAAGELGEPPWPALLADLVTRFRVIIPELPADRGRLCDWLGAFLDGLGLLNSLVVTDLDPRGGPAPLSACCPERVRALVALEGTGSEAVARVTRRLDEATVTPR